MGKTASQNDIGEGRGVCVKLYLDFDNTIADSISAFIESEIYGKEYTCKPHPFEVTQYDFKNVFPHLNSADIIANFESDIFWHKLKPFDGMLELIKEILNSKDFSQIFVCTKGTVKNLQMKEQWINENMPFFPKANIIFDTNLITTKRYIRDGEQPSILIDDHQDNLYSARCKYKILINHYKTTTDWNDKAMKDSNILKVDCADRLQRLIDRISFHEQFVQIGDKAVG